MLDPLLEEGLRTGRLEFTTEFADLAVSPLVFVCVGTPQQPDSPAADLSQVRSAVHALSAVLAPGSSVVGKSTTPAGTALTLSSTLAPSGLHLAWNPEFLREGTAVSDTLHPERIVLGSEHPGVIEILREVYRLPIAEGSHFLSTDPTTAEMVKTAANAFLAAKVSFINAVSDLCDRTGADVEMVATALGLDSRIGPKFLKAGLGYGGGCFPKDVRALSHHASELGASPLASLLDAVDAANLDARHRALATLESHLPSPTATVAVLGAAFKPGSDDVRDSPAVWLVSNLRARHPGLTITWHDPALSGRTIADLTLTASVPLATAAADLLVLATDWPEYRSLNPATLPSRAKTLLDLRNCIPAAPWVNSGWAVHRLGRPSVHPSGNSV